MGPTSYPGETRIRNLNHHKSCVVDPLQKIGTQGAPVTKKISKISKLLFLKNGIP